MSDTRSIMGSGEPFDALIIGGGIVGACIARDAALRHLRVALVEQADFASGTSSRSSRLLHGGLRYLAQGRFGLVQSAQREKVILQHIAPHLFKPLPFVFPAYAGEGWPAWMLKLGVRVYDHLCQSPSFPSSKALAREDLRTLVPGLREAGLQGGVLYHDGFTSDARLVLDTLRSAEAAGARLASYTRFNGARQDGALWQCSVEDVESGLEGVLAARAVINAAGPWAHQIPGSHLSLRLTKGVHAVVAHERLPFRSAVVLPRYGRILFLLPWGRRTIIGTTDTDYDGPLADPECTTEDLATLLDAVNAFFPDARLEPGDVVATWAGLRPLTGGRHGTPSSVSRSHTIRQTPQGWFDVAGGKLTTGRLIAEQVTDRLINHLGFRARPCTTHLKTLLPPDLVEGLSGVRPPPLEAGPIRHYCRNEWARHLDDIMLRRAGWHYEADDRAADARACAGHMAAELGWDEARIRAELGAYQLYCAAPTSAQQSVAGRCTEASSGSRPASPR